MPLVLDNSVVVAWFFESEATSFTDRILADVIRGSAFVPAIWPLELTNALLTAERRQRLSSAEVARSITLIRSLSISVDSLGLDRAAGAVLALAREYRLTTYDASYLELALRENLPLATLDARLGEAAARAGVERLS